MKVVHLSTHDIRGGAARAAHRLHTGLRRLGHDSQMLVLYRHSSDPAVRALRRPASLLSRVRRRLRRDWIRLALERYAATRPAGYERFSQDRTEYGADLLAQLPACDVVNLHWIGGFVDYQSFFAAVAAHTPLVWTLHDTNPFTGGCHYDGGCGRYNSGCGTCPQLGSKHEKDLSSQIWQRKLGILGRLQRERLHIVAQSRWMANEASSSVLLRRFPVTTIPIGLDTDVFSPRDHRTARAALEIPQDARVVLFAADSATNRRKGFDLLTQALACLSDLPNVFLVSLGRGEPVIEAQIPHLHLGHLGNDRLLSLVYSSADVFVIPSLQDNLPNTVLESLACCTPVVGFAVGGIPDMVHPGVTGLLAPAQDVGALGRAIRQLLEDPDTRARMAANCRRVAVEEYALEKQAQAYVDLYRRVVDRHSRCASAV